MIEEEKSVLGGCIVRENTKLMDNEINCLELYGISIIPERRNEGLGRQLIDYLKEKYPIIATYQPENSETIDFFLKMNF